MEGVYTLDTLLSKLHTMTPCRYKTYMVLDDLHMLQNEELLAVLPLLLEALPKGFSVLLLSRFAPPDSFKADLDKGTMRLLGAEDLRFTKDEIRELFAYAGKELDSHMLEEIMKRTEGWAISLSAELMANTHDRSATLHQYLDKFVWPKWDAQTRSFLLRCCIAKDLTPDLCRALTREPDAGQTLQKLVQQGAFLTETGTERYRLHDLFHDYLQSRAKRELEPHTVEITRRAYAKWLTSQQDYYGALREYTLLLDGAGINESLRIISDFSIPQAVESEMNFAKQHVIGKLPEGFIEENPYLLEMMPWAHFLDGDAAGFTQWMDKLGEQLPRFMADYPSLIETASFMGSLDFRLPLQKIAEFTASQLASLPPTQEEEKKAKSSSITQNLPYFHRSMRDYSEYHLLDTGDLQLLRNTFGLLIGPEYTVYEHCLIGGIQYEQNRMLDACQNALQAYHHIRAGAGPETVFSAQMLLAAVLEHMGSWRYANQLYTEAAESITQSHADYLRANLRAVLTRRRIRGGDTDAAAEWLRYFATDETVGKHLAYYRLTRHFTTLDALTAAGHWDRANAFAVRLFQLGEAYNRPLDMLETAVLHCEVHEQVGKHKEAEDRLMCGLTLARRFGFKRVFIENGSRIIHVLNRLLDMDRQKQEDLAFMQELRIDILKSQGTQAEQATPVLSAQQAKMLAELKTGGIYADIAERTGLSKSSVKTHLVRLNKTLEVHSAEQALEKAKMLNLT